jgi:hypothetical protein
MKCRYILTIHFEGGFKTTVFHETPPIRIYVNSNIFGVKVENLMIYAEV